MNGEIKVPIRKLDLAVLHCTVEVTREFTLRMRVGIGLIRLAAFVLGCGIEVDVKGLNKCACGRISERSSLNLAETEPQDGYRNFKALGGNFGCEKHPPIACCYNLDGSIALTIPDGHKLDRERNRVVPA